MITLTYGANVLTLPNAQLGEPQNLKSGLKIHYTMTGRIITYGTASSRGWTLTIVNMKDSDVTNLKAWFLGYTGQIVTYVDNLGVSYTVNIVNTTLTVTQVNDCLYTTVLELRINNG